MNKKRVIWTVIILCFSYLVLGEEMELKEKIVEIEKEIGDWVYAGDLYSRSPVFRMEIEKQELYLNNVQILFTKGLLTENQQIIAVMLIQNKNISDMKMVLEKLVALYISNDISEQIIELMLNPMGTNYVLQNNHNDKEIRVILEKLIGSSICSDSLKRNIEAFLKGNWWKAIKQNDPNWKMKI